jgi:hypothetical protein
MKGKNCLKNFTIWIALTAEGINGSAEYHIADVQLEIVTLPTAALMSHNDWYPSRYSQKGDSTRIGAWHQCYQTLRHTESQSLWERGAGGSRGSDF